jgi:hypothetical protein
LGKGGGVITSSKNTCSSSSCPHTHHSTQPGSCGRLTPGSSSSLVARRRRRLQSPSSGLQQQRQQQQLAGVGRHVAADPYDFDALELSDTHEAWQQQQQQRVAWPAAATWSPNPRTALSFTPTSASGDCLQAAAAGARHMPFASPISPPPLKPHVLLASPAAAGRRQNIAPGAVGLTPGTAAAGGAATVRRAGGKAGPKQQLGCMTAPAKAPSSRMFARQRQQLSQQLYDQWNAQVRTAADAAATRRRP